MTEKEPGVSGIDGTVRLAHYGSGRQPWDDIKKNGWGPGFCAGSVLKYLRRDSAAKGVSRERDLHHARVYFGWLHELAEPPSWHVVPVSTTPHAFDVYKALINELQPGEHDLLRAPDSRS